MTVNPDVRKRDHELAAGAAYPPEHVIYRDVFDHFFQYLEELDHYLSVNLAQPRDIMPISYWLKPICFQQFDVEPNPFPAYLTKYRYVRVLDLIKRFGLNAKSGSISSK
jgi:hypothetical protein